MKVAAGREFFEQFGSDAQQAAPALEWALMEADGTWSKPPDDCDLIALAGDAYNQAFMAQTAALPAPRWAHSEDAGTDGPFYDAMREKGAILTHSPGANAPEVAEFAMALVLWSAKRLGPFQAQAHARQWRMLELESLSDKTVLVAGLGNIGSKVAHFAKAFGMHVLGIRGSSTPVPSVDELGTLDALGEMLPRADFVILALPHRQETTNVIDAAALGAMKSSATLINVGRGALIDIPALKHALSQRQIAQACLDVLPREPWPADDDLWSMEHAFITPHNAASSPLYAPRVAAVWIENLGRYVRGEAMLHRAF